MSPESRVLRQLIEALATERLITPAKGGWDIADLSICAPYRIGGFDRVRLLADPVGANGLALCMPEVVRALANTGFDAGKLRLALSRTAHFLREAGPPRPNRLSLRGCDLEAALTEGHPYHPCFKSRFGFSDADNAAFGPERGRGFSIQWLAADPALVTATGTPIATAMGIETPAGRTLMPVHPWQWRHLSQNSAIQAWLLEGRITPIDECGPQMRATQSIRTLAPMAGSGDHIKLSLAIGVTSSVRDFAAWSVAVAPAISSWLERVVAEDPAFQQWPLTILSEHGAVILGRDELGGSLAALRRMAPPEGAVPLNALTLYEPDGAPLIGTWLQRYGVTRWVARFMEVALLPVWHLICAHGIALEAHAQNLLLLHDEGWPTGLVARDFHESLEYVSGCLTRPELVPDLASIDPNFASAPDGKYHRMADPTELRDLVLDCLGVHVLSDLANLLHAHGWLPEAQFWSAYRATIALHTAKFGSPATAFGMFAPLIPAERLAGQVLGVKSANNLVSNPLAERLQMTSFYIDSRRVDTKSLMPSERSSRVDLASARIALHLASPADCLAQILTFRGAGATVYPIHPETPHDQALDLARLAGCNQFVNGDGKVDLHTLATASPGGGLIQMSSGTTGTPKVIVRTWASIETEIQAYRAAFPGGDTYTPVIAAPITHSFGLIAGVLVGLARGKVPVVLSSTNPMKILRQLADIDTPLLYAAPALLYALSQLAGPCRLPAAVMSSGTVLPQKWFDTISGAARALYQQYGCSETGCLTLTTAPSSPEDMGLPLSHVRLLAGLNIPAPVRVEGGPDTGDLGMIDGRGHLIFAARAAEVIDVAGINVYPAEIERVALALPGVTDAVAFALPDAVSHQRPGLAFIGEVSLEALEAHLSAHLSARQRPLQVFRVESMPRGPGGKVARRHFSEQFGVKVIA